MGADDLHRSVIGSRVPAQLGIVLGEEVLVEIEPRIFGAGEHGGGHHGHDAQQQVEGGGDVGAGLGIGQNLHGPRQQVVLNIEGLHRAFERERVRPFAAAQQQGEGNGLSIRIRKLLVRSVWEQQLPPVAGQLR